MSHSFFERPRGIALSAVACVLALAGCAFAQQSASPAKGDVVFQSDFETSNALGSWSGSAELSDGFQSEKAVSIKTKQGRSAMISIRLPVERVRGCVLRGSAMVKAADVGAKPNSWNGIKFMLAIESPGGKTWPQAALDTGSFDWKRTGFSTRIPSDANSATLILGLEEVAGKVCFDDVKITVASVPATIPTKTQTGPAFKGHRLPRLRGAMVSPNASAQDLAALGRDWKANLIRWQLIRTPKPGAPNSMIDYDRWLEGELKKLDTLLPVCETNGLMVVVDLHSPPGGRPTVSGYAGTDDRLFTDKSCQDQFVEVWRRIATRYKDVKTIWGYDLANEPVEEDVAEDCLDWHDLAERAAIAIREIDPNRALIVEAPPWGGPASLKDFAPIAVSNVVYSVHMYEPMAFTHQGVFSKSAPRPVYPGIIDGKKWDACDLEAVLQPVIDFQKRYNVPIYIGEFSAIRWAPDHSAARYLGDVIDIFEKNGWDWSYHAFREWQGWSVEHGDDQADPRPASQPTDRQRLLLTWFSKNLKPRAGDR